MFVCVYKKYLLNIFLPPLFANMATNRNSLMIIHNYIYGWTLAFKIFIVIIPCYKIATNSLLVSRFFSLKLRYFSPICAIFSFSFSSAG